MIECQLCENVFNADTVQAHCFECDIAKVRDRLAEKEKELEGKDRIILELTENLREVKEDRAFYKRILEDERAMITETHFLPAMKECSRNRNGHCECCDGPASFIGTPKPFVSHRRVNDLVEHRAAIQAQNVRADKHALICSWRLTIMLMIRLLSVQHVDAAISTDEGSTAPSNSRDRGAQASPQPPPEQILPAKTAAGIQVKANEVPSLQGKRSMFGNASLNAPSPVGGLRGSLASAQNVAPTAAGIQAGANEIPSLQGKRPAFGIASLNAPSPVGGLWGSFSSAQNGSLFPPLAPPAKSDGLAGGTKVVRSPGDSPTISSGSSGVAGGPSTGFVAIGAAASRGGFSFGPSKPSSNTFPNSQFTFQVPYGLDSGSSKSSAPKGLPLRDPSATELGQKRL
ncbi:hypothetical protein FS837_005277 [Tulasnella sp. UAMH 9824]|nr:hypothetical protein FS837_005277 [Tulasnella sp. UAMH 9824]